MVNPKETNREGRVKLLPTPVNRSVDLSQQICRHHVNRSSDLVSATDKKPQKGQQAVEHQQFVAEVIAPEALGGGVEGITDQGRGDADIRHPSVIGLVTGKESEGKESQQGSVSIADNDVDGVYQARGVHYLEQHYKQYENGTHQQMYALAQWLVVFFFADVDAIDGCH